jgi:hypothetical protein
MRIVPLVICLFVNVLWVNFGHAQLASGETWVKVRMGETFGDVTYDFNGVNVYQEIDFESYRDIKSPRAPLPVPSTGNLPYWSTDLYFNRMAYFDYDMIHNTLTRKISASGDFLGYLSYDPYKDRSYASRFKSSPAFDYGDFYFRVSNPVEPWLGDPRLAGYSRRRSVVEFSAKPVRRGSIVSFVGAKLTYHMHASGTVQQWENGVYPISSDPRKLGTYPMTVQTKGAFVYSKMEFNSGDRRIYTSLPQGKIVLDGQNLVNGRSIFRAEYRYPSEKQAREVPALISKQPPGLLPGFRSQQPLGLFFDFYNFVYSANGSVSGNCSVWIKRPLSVPTSEAVSSGDSTLPMQKTMTSHVFPNMSVSGAGIPRGRTVASVEGSTVTLSGTVNAMAAGSVIDFSFNDRCSIYGASFESAPANAGTIVLTGSLKGLVVPGMLVLREEPGIPFSSTGTGIPRGTTVSVVEEIDHDDGADKKVTVLTLSETLSSGGIAAGVTLKFVMPHEMPFVVRGNRNKVTGTSALTLTGRGISAGVSGRVTVDDNFNLIPTSTTLFGFQVDY